MKSFIWLFAVVLLLFGNACTRKQDATSGSPQQGNQQLDQNKTGQQQEQQEPEDDAVPDKKGAKENKK